MCMTHFLAGMTAAVAGMGLIACGTCRAEPPAAGDALVIRLVHPDRQSQELLRSFAGARVAHPAAALAAWKRSNPGANLLSKPLEAVITFFNPDMAAEWRVLHEAEIRVNFGTTDGRAHWFATVPRDDGTLSAAVTAMRLTDGTNEAPVSLAGKSIVVERLGPASVVSARIDDLLVFGASRDDLVRGLVNAGEKMTPAPAGGGGPDTVPASAASKPENRLDSGLVFELDPGRLASGVGTTAFRRTVALLNGMGARRISGILAVNNDSLALDVTTLLTPAGPASRLPSGEPASIDPAWLRWVSARDVMGAISIAFESGSAFWDWAFAFADRIERADPLRGDVAPVRTRFNLLATAAGARPEVDLWPHLKGVTAGVMAGPTEPGRPAGALVILHTDSEASAERIANDVLPRLVALMTGQKPAGNRSRATPQPKSGLEKLTGRVEEERALSLGKAGGRSLLAYLRDRDVVIAWGDDVLPASIEAAARPDRSIAPRCADWARRGKGPPQRLGVIWPARCWPPVRGVDTTSPGWRVLAQDPPAVWWGWTRADTAHDSIHLSGLRQRVHQFIDQISLDPGLLP